MTLKQAFTNWSMAPRNIALAAKSRDAVQKVLMKKYADIDLEQITETFARRLFKECTESQDFKIKAAAILVYLLCWGGDHGYCQRPTFDYTIAHTDEPTKPKSFTKIVAEMKARNEEKVESKTEENMEEKKTVAPVRNKRPVAQIDTKTLQVIKVWPSVTQAHTELHIQNIDRAIERRGIAGGFFWCDEKDVATFKPAKHGERTKIEQKKKTEAPKTLAEAEKPKSLVDKFEEEYQQFKATREVQIVNKDLSVFTDQQLIDELIRRGYKGTISITITKEITL